MKKMDKNTEDNAKIVEMDLSQMSNNLRSTNSYSVTPTKMVVEYGQQYGCGHIRRLSKSEGQQQFSPVSSVLTEISPRTCMSTAQDSPQHSSATSAHDGRRSSTSHSAAAGANDQHLVPNYMTNTESSRAKARSQSAPKQWSWDAGERPSNRRRNMPAEGTRAIVPRSSRMQRSSSHIGSSIEYYPWRIKLDRSNMSLMESECGSTTTSTVLSKANCYHYGN